MEGLSSLAGGFGNIIMISGMVAPLVFGSTQFDQKSRDLDQAIEDMKAQLQDYKNKYESLFQQQAADEDALKDYMNNLVQKITDLSTRIRVSKQEHQVAYRSIQIGGLIVTVTLIFIFTMKIFGIDKIIYNIFPSNK